MIWALIVLVLCSSAYADVTRKHRISSEFMGAYEGTTEDSYAGDRHCSESANRWTRGIMKTMSGGKEIKTVTITRLDREVIWQLDPAKKSYTEMTFAEMREQMKQAVQGAEEAEDQPPDTMSEDQYEWKLEDKSEAQPKTIAGYTCRNVRTVATGTNRLDTLDYVVIEMNSWNSPDVPGQEEIRAYQERYVKALGLGEMALTPGLAQAAALFNKQLQALMEASKRAPGEPVTNEISIKRHRPKGKSLGSAVGEAARDELMSKLPFGRKKSQPVKEERPEYELRTSFSVDMQLLEAGTQTVEAAKYEIPPGYKLKKK